MNCQFFSKKKIISYLTVKSNLILAVMFDIQDKKTKKT